MPCIRVLKSKNCGIIKDKRLLVRCFIRAISVINCRLSYSPKKIQKYQNSNGIEFYISFIYQEFHVGCPEAQNNSGTWIPSIYCYAILQDIIFEIAWLVLFCVFECKTEEREVEQTENTSGKFLIQRVDQEFVQFYSHSL